MAVKLIVGLGNPGSKYETTRHNVGRNLVEFFAAKHDLKFSRKSGLKASLCSYSEPDHKIILAYPETYMNVSGEPVLLLKRYFKVRVNQLLVVVDDMDLPVSRLRLRAKGSSGGHNGLKSIEASLGSQDYARLRVGIGRPGLVSDVGFPGLRGAPDHVLSSFSKSESAALGDLFEGPGCEALNLWINTPIQNAMSSVNA